MSDLDEMPRSNSMSQWIISLAISIVCCACLFVVLAFYITDQHITVSTVSLRMDLLQQRQDRLSNEIELLRHGVIAPQARVQAPAAVAPTAQAPSAQNNGAPQAEGVAVDRPEEVAPFVPPKMTTQTISK